MAEFIKGCLQLKGFAQSKDLLAIQAQADILAHKMDELGKCLTESERMIEQLDMISYRTLHRFEPAVQSTKRKIAAKIGGSQPLVHTKSQRGEEAPLRKDGDEITPLQLGNVPALPQLPNLLR